jgi:hypothetical protein
VCGFFVFLEEDGFLNPFRLTCATQLLNAGCRITSIQKFLGHKRLNTTLTYARVHDQTVAEDYFAAMSSIEKRLVLLGKEEEKPQEVSESEREELLALTDQLLSPKISLELCIEVAAHMRTLLERDERIPPSFKNQKALLDHPPPISAF